jgi:hypothetical protein
MVVWEAVPVTVRDSKVTSRGNSAPNGSIQVLESVDRQWLVNRFSIHLSGWVDEKPLTNTRK